MSLAHTAEYLKKHGRGPDDQLVHMSSNELRGLQKLAKSTGGSLTVNPHTGLPEAGFLDAILPTVIGVGLDIATGGAATPLEIGLGVGGLDTLMTGNLGQGLMAGLGAYGGAGLSGALGSMGAASTALTDTAGQLGVEGASTAPGSQAAMLAEQNAGMGTQGLQSVRDAAATAEGVGAQTAIPNSVANVSQGISQLGQPGGLSTLSNTLSSATPYAKAGLAASALGALTPNAFGATTVPGSNPQSNPMNLSTISPNFKGYVPPQPSPYYKAQYTDYTQNPYAPKTMAQGGLAMGGMPGQMYPQSQQDHTVFSDPTQLPASAMAVRNFEPSTNPMTGDMTKPMASGGHVKHFDGGGGVQGGGQMHLDVPISVGGGGGGDQGGFAGYGGGQSGDGGGPGYMQSPAQSIGGKGGMGLQQMQQQPLQQQMQQQPAQGFGNKGGSGMSVESQFPGQMGGAGNVYAQPFMQMSQMLQGLGQGQGNAYAQQPGFIGNPIGPPNINMAEGGKVPGYAAGHLARTPSMPDTGEFYDTNISTRNLPADQAGIALLKQRAKQAGIKLADMPKTTIQQLGGDFSDSGAHGGVATLGSYSDGGHLLKGPGDGMSDDIPAQIGKHQPARLADGEFVVPADVVSHLGNGSTDAGAKKLYSMMDKIRKARTGRKTQGKQINANKFLPK